LRKELNKSGFTIIEILIVVFLTSIVLSIGAGIIEDVHDYSKHQSAKSTIISFLDECAQISIKNMEGCEVDIEEEFIVIEYQNEVVRKEKIIKNDINVSLNRKIQWYIFSGSSFGATFKIVSPYATEEVRIASTGRVLSKYVD